MTVTRRLLLAARGGASFPAPPFSLRSLASDGFWNDIAEPRAWSYNGQTYLTFVNDSGDVKVAAYDHAAGTTSTPYTVATGYSSMSGNVHNSSSIIVRASDRRLVVASCAEGQTSIHVRVSTNPEDATAWGSQATILSGTGTFTYTQMVQLANGELWLFTQHEGTPTTLSYTKSSDGGSTWSAIQRLVKPTASSRRYGRIGASGNRIDIFTTDTDRSTANPSSVYHLYLEGGSAYQSDGTLISASWPFLADEGTLVQDTTYGRARPGGWAYDTSGNPACAMNCRTLGSDTPPEYVRAARFDGSTWTTHAVMDSGSQLVVAASMLKDNPNVIFAPKLVGSALEMYRWGSRDDGATWTGTQLTATGADDHEAPDTPVDATRLQATWGYGIYTGPGFAYDVKGWAW